MFVSKQLMDLVDFNSIYFFHAVEVNGVPILFTHNLQNIFLCVQRKKEGMSEQ